MLQGIFSAAMGLALIGAPMAWSDPSGKVPMHPKESDGKPQRFRTPGEERSVKHHDCFKKYQKTISEKFKGQREDSRRIRKQAMDIRRRLEESDTELAALKSKKSALSASLGKPGAKADSGSLSELIETDKKIRERQAALNDSPELKPLMDKMRESSLQMRETWRGIVGQDKSCADLLLGESNPGQTRNPSPATAK